MNKITNGSMFLERIAISCSIVAIVAMTMTSMTIVQACTSTAIPTPEGTIIGRSMELGGTTKLLSAILQMNGLNNTQPSFTNPAYTLHEEADRLIPWLLAVHPAGQQQGGCIICGLDSDTWNSTYGFVSVDVRIDPRAIFQNMTSATEKESPLQNWMEQLGSNLVHGAVTLEALLMKQDIFEVSTDGMNEAGLTVSSLVLYESEYQTPLSPSRRSTARNSNLRVSSVPVAAEDAIRKICWLDFSHWILGNFHSTSDLRETLQESANTLYTIGPLLSVFEDFNIHWRVDDAEGHSIVIEYLQGTLTIHNNTVGVLTNDPPFDWHLHNLGTYSHLQPTRTVHSSTQTGAFQLNSDIGIVPAHPGTGTNTLGLPGDYTSESRFVKMFYLTQFALFHNPMQTIEAALPTMSGLLNTVFIPIGTVPVKEHDNTDDEASTSSLMLFGGEFTQYSVMKVPQQKLFYYKDYYNNQWRSFDLSTMDLSQPAYKLLADGSFNIMDETNTLFTN